MKINCLRSIVICFASLLTGCFGPSIEPEFYKLTSQPSADTAEITVIRSKSFGASGRSIPVGLDGRKISNLAIGENVTFNIAPGVHTVGVWGLTGVSLTF